MISSVECVSFKDFALFSFVKEIISLEEELEVSLEELEFKENLDWDILLASILSLLECQESEEKFFYSFNSYSIYNLKIKLILL